MKTILKSALAATVALGLGLASSSGTLAAAQDHRGGGPYTAGGQRGAAHSGAPQGPAAHSGGPRPVVPHRGGHDYGYHGYSGYDGWPGYLGPWPGYYDGYFEGYYYDDEGCPLLRQWDGYTHRWVWVSVCD